jgi:hypothetical protein
MRLQSSCLGAECIEAFWHDKLATLSLPATRRRARVAEWSAAVSGRPCPLSGSIRHSASPRLHRGTFRAAARSMKARRIAWRVAQVLLALVLLIALGIAGFLLFLGTERGREYARNEIGHLVSLNIPGRLEIGSIERFNLDVLVANDVRFYHHDGRLLLRAKHAEVVPDLAMALGGRFGFERAWVDGGFIILSIDPDGRLSLEAALNYRRRPGVPDVPLSGLHYDMRSMHVKNFTTELQVSGKTLRLVDTTGYVRVRRIETDGTEVMLDRIEGKLTPDIAGATVAFNRVDGWIHGKQFHTVHGDADLKIDSGRLKAQIDVFDRPKKPVQVHLQESKGLASTAMKWMLKAADVFTGAIDVTGDG